MVWRKGWRDQAYRIEDLNISRGVRQDFMGDVKEYLYGVATCSQYFSLVMREILDPLDSYEISLSIFPVKLNDLSREIERLWSAKELRRLSNRLQITYDELQAVRAILALQHNPTQIQLEKINGLASRIEESEVLGDEDFSSPAGVLEKFLKLGIYVSELRTVTGSGFPDWFKLLVLSHKYQK